MNNGQTAHKVLRILPFLVRHMDTGLRAHGLHPSHMGLLRLLHCKPSHLGDLADELGVTAATTSNTVNTLEERGLVKRTSSGQDRRMVLVELTPEGAQLLRQVYNELVLTIDGLMSTLSAEERVKLDEGLAILLRVTGRMDQPDTLVNDDKPESLQPAHRSP